MRLSNAVRHALFARMLALTAVCVAAPASPLAQEGARFGAGVASSQDVKEMSRKELRRIFLGQVTEWPSGKPVVLVLAPRGSPPMRWLCEKLLDMPEEVYRRHLLRRVFEGQLAKPIQARDLRHAKERIAETEGAVGPLDLADLPKTLRALRPRKGARR